MQRLSNIKKPTFILCGDFHLREDQPICRTDDFWEAQWKKVDFVASLQEKFDIPVLHSGDLFHTWKSSPYLLSSAMQHLPKKFYTVLGNHDLPQHNLDLFEKSSVYTLYQAGALEVLKECSYGQEPSGMALSIRSISNEGYEEISKIDKINPPSATREPFPLTTESTEKRILVWHKMAYQTPPYPGATGGNAKQLLQKYSSYDLILTGDNHQPFVEEYEGRILVNPGSLTRQTATQIDHKPRVYLYYAETNTVEPIYLPIEDVISREHLEVKEERDSRLEAFIEHLNEDWDSTLSFEDNLKAFKDANEVSEEVMKIIYKAINT